MDLKRPGPWLVLSSGGFSSTLTGPPVRGKRSPALIAPLLLTLLSAALVVLPISGCGGGDDDDVTEADGKKRKKRNARESGDDGDSDIEVARENALEILRTVKAKEVHKSLADDYERATGYLKKARRYKDDADFKKARSYYKRAQNLLREMLDASAENAAQVAEATDARKRADEARAGAQKAEAEKNAPTEWKDGEKYYKEGIAALEKREVDVAVAAFEDAAATFDEAEEMALEGKRARLLAERFKANMAGLKQRARKAGADVKAISIWQQADSAEIEAATYLETGDFEIAAQNYRSATQMYTQALKSVMDEAAFAEEMEVARAEQRKRLEAWQEQQRERGTLAGRVPPPPPSPGSSGNPTSTPVAPPIGGFPPGIGIDLGPPALCVKDVATSFPQELDDEDEAFLVENLHHLSKAARYDPDTGGIELDYSNGERLKTEIITGSTPSRHVWFRDKQLASAGGDIPESAWTSMFGNTKGFVQIPVPFKYQVRMTWAFGIETMTGKGNFGAFVALDKKKKSRLRTNFADIGLIQSSSPPKWRRGKKPGPNANYWHTKQREVNWVVEFTSENPDGKSTLETIYHHGGEEEFSNKVTGKLGKTGFVGFEWAETRFRIKKLKVCGFLDKEAAVAILREQLNQPKGEPGADDDDDDDADDDGDVTVAPSEDGDEDSDGGEEEAGTSDPDEDFDF